MHNPRFDFINNEEVLDTLKQLVKEGKIRSFAMALGPDIGWLEEGLDAMNHEPIAIQIIYNLLEQEPSKFLFEKSEKTSTGLIARVPHASGIMDGTFTKERTFEKSDHRSHRKQKWMEAGLQAKKDLDFLYKENDRTIGQAAILFSLAVKNICTVLPNFTNHEEIDEFTEASDMPPLSDSDLTKIEDLWNNSHSDILSQPFSDSTTKPTPT